jgi:ATP-dependent RNA helicase RhlE
MLFSATMPRPIVTLSRDLLVNPARLDIERPSAPATGVSQTILPVPEKLKPALLLTMLRKEDVRTALVFTRTKHRANRLFKYLDDAGIPCDRIHGNRSQPQRQAALKAFKDGRIKVLVATDIAARGIDIEALPHVINFDVPGQAEDYIHRVGRTARAKLEGDALTFASPGESRELAAIERAVGHRIARRQIDGFDYNAKPKGRLEIPIGERIAEIRAQRAGERARSRAKKEAKESRAAATAAAPPRPPRQRRRRPGRRGNPASA